MNTLMSDFLGNGVLSDTGFHEINTSPFATRKPVSPSAFFFTNPLHCKRFNLIVTRSALPPTLQSKDT